MDRSLLPRELRPFVADDGRLTQWPSRQKVQRLAAVLLARRFAPGRTYTEREVNFVLMDGHTFADWALLRRTLVDWRFLARDSNGHAYRLCDDAPLEFPAPAEPGA